jgi:hypothetical protein
VFKDKVSPSLGEAKLQEQEVLSFSELVEPETEPSLPLRRPRQIATIEDESFFAAISTSIEYVSNDLRKKQKKFFMVVTTVFLTVSFLTFLSLLG